MHSWLHVQLPETERDFSLLLNVQIGPGATPSRLYNAYCRLFICGLNCQALVLASHLHLVPKLRMSTATNLSLHPNPYAFGVWRGTVVPLTFCSWLSKWYLQSKFNQNSVAMNISSLPCVLCVPPIPLSVIWSLQEQAIWWKHNL